MVTSNTARAGGKSSSAFRTISEVSQELEVPQHVLRFWETKFSSVRPLKRGGGRRYYRPEDINLLRHIRDLLYAEGYTIRGVQKVLRDSQGKLPEEEPQERTGNQEDILRELITELSELRDMLLKASKSKS